MPFILSLPDRATFMGVWTALEQYVTNTELHHEEQSDTDDETVTEKAFLEGARGVMETMDAAVASLTVESVVNAPSAPETARVIDAKLFTANQSVHFVAVYSWRKHKLRVKIERNAYDEQSSLRLERWDGASWRFVHALPISAALCRKASYVDRDLSYVRPLFESDAATLLAFGIQILGE